MPKVSVIMGTHNGGKYIRRAIESILNQSYSDFEFIICDDCSTDNVVEVIKSFKDKRIILIGNEQQLGLAASLNRCIEFSKGEYLARMDDDDISHSDRFEKQVDFLDTHPEYAIVGCCRRTFDNRGVWNTYGIGGELSKQDIIKGKTFTHPSVIMRKVALVNSGCYTVSERTIRGQDFDLWCKMYAHGYKGYVLCDILFDYYVDRSSIKVIKPKFRINNFKTHMIWRKKMGLPRKYDIYAYKELLTILMPQKILVAYKKRHKQK